MDFIIRIIINKFKRNGLYYMTYETVYKENAIKYQYRHSYSLEEDFLFASEFYSVKDFRYEFIDQYKQALLQVLNKKIYNCRIEENIDYPNILEVYVYLDDCREKIEFVDIKVQQGNPFIVSFFEVLHKCPLPDLKLYRFRFHILNINIRKMSYMLEDFYSEINDMLPKKFSQINNIDIWNGRLYVFIKDGFSLKKLKEKGVFEDIRREIFINIKQKGGYELQYDEFHISVDEAETAKQLGRNYFNSDAMEICEMI